MLPAFALTWMFSSGPLGPVTVPLSEKTALAATGLAMGSVRLPTSRATTAITVAQCWWHRDQVEIVDMEPHLRGRIATPLWDASSRVGLASGSARSGRPEHGPRFVASRVHPR